MGAPFAQIVNSVGTLAAGHIVLATEWNTAVGGIYTWLNNTLLSSGLNSLSAKGDVYVFNGTSNSGLGRLPVGTDGQFLTARSSAANGLGVDWESAVNTITLNTKGDLLTYSGSALVRLPIGTNGQVLTADSGQTNGLAWETAPGVPLGGMLLWDLSQRALPTGYVVCDGGTYNGYVTQNTQGLYLVGSGGGIASAAANGMGNVACGTTAGDVMAAGGVGTGSSHNHAVSLISNASGSFTGGYGTLSPTGNTTVTPRYIALAVIMRTQ